MKPRKRADETIDKSRQIETPNGKQAREDQPDIDPELLAEFKQWEAASDEDFRKFEASLDDE